MINLIRRLMGHNDKFVAGIAQAELGDRFREEPPERGRGSAIKRSIS